MAVGDAQVFPGFLTLVLINSTFSFQSKPTTFLTCFSRGERWKYAGKKVRLNRVSNSQPPGHESDTLTTEQPGRGNYLCIHMYFVICTYSITCCKGPFNGSNESRLLQQVAFKCRFYYVALRRIVVSEQWSLKASGLLIQVVSNTGLTVYMIYMFTIQENFVMQCITEAAMFWTTISKIFPLH